MFGLVGKKRGMTRLFEENGDAIAVTVIEVAPNHVVQVKNQNDDGYNAVQLAWGTKKSSRANKSWIGHFAKNNIVLGEGLCEFRFAKAGEYKIGDQISVDAFTAGQKVDVTGRSKGKGFQGVIKRWNFRMQDATHGNSLSHRAPGSIGQCQTPGRVFKGKKMSGQMGNVRSTVQSLEILRVDKERNLILVKGAVPGANGSDVMVKSAVKVSV